MNNGLRRRVEMLGQRASCDPITLVFDGGSQRVIKGSTRHWRALNDALFERDNAKADGLPVPESPLSIELAWLAECTEISGANAQVFALTKALIDGCNREGEDGGPQ